MLHQTALSLTLTEPQSTTVKTGAERLKPNFHSKCQRIFQPKNERWWATLESNQACVSARELQSPATPCGLSPTGRVVANTSG